MTVATLNPSIAYLENGVTVTHPVPWRFEPGTLVVKRINTATGAVVTLAAGPDYSATGGATDAGGSITKTSAGVAGDQILIERFTPRSQAMNYTTGDTFPAESHENAIDRLTLIEQEQDNAAAVLSQRALQVPVGETVALLPRQADRQQKFLYFDDLGQPMGKPMEELPYLKGNAGDLTPGAQAVLDAATRLLTTVAGLTQAATPPIPFDPLTVFTGGFIGGLYIVEPQYLRVNADGTGGQPVENGVFRRMLNVQGDTDFDLVSPAGQSWTLRREFGIWYAEWTAGNCMHSFANVTMRIPSTLIFTGSFSEYDRTLFGFVKNTGCNHIIVSDNSLSWVQGSINGGSDIPARGWEQTWSNRWSAAKNAVSVFTSRVRSDGVLETWLEDTPRRTLEGAVNPTGWTPADTVAGMTFGINCSSQSLGIGVANVSGAGRFYGGLVINNELSATEAASVQAYFQGRSRPTPTAADRVILCFSDSTGDGVGTDSGTIDDEVFEKLTREYFTTAYPNDTIFFRRWSREPDCFMGYERIGTGTQGKTFILNCGASGTNPEYFFAERFQRAIGWLDHVDMAIFNFGHNMAVGDAQIIASPYRKHLRAGAFIGPIDQLRARFPSIWRFGVTNCYPVGVAADARIDAVKDAVAYVQADLYGDGFVIDTFAAFDTPGRLASYYCADLLHPSLGDGVAAMKTAGQTAIAAAPLKAAPTRPLISQRRIAYAENLVVDGAFETFTAGGNPVHWPTFGDGVAVRSNEVIGRGATVKVTGSNGGITQTINVAALAGQVVTLSVFMNVLGTSGFNAGRVRFRCNGASLLGDGRWYNEPYRAFDAFYNFVSQFAIPADATTLTVDLYAGAGSAGTVYFDRVILAAGELPRDFIH